MTDRSRHVPEKVCSALMEEARGRCCLCRELILEGSNRHEAIAEVLEKHHLIFFSAGGEHTPENLLLVCPNCHRLIHRRPEDYPTALLKETKKRWIDMGSRFPSQILYKGPPPCLGPQEELRLACYPFCFETYGLTYSIIAPDSLRVSQFAAFLKQRIVNVIASMDDNTAFQDAERFYLSRKNAIKEDFPDSMLLREFELDDDVLVLNMHVNVVARAIMDNTVRLEALPGNPKAGERYEVTISHTFPGSLQVSITVDGTDEYKLHEEGVTANGSFSVIVPGGAGGVQDSIVGHGEFGSLRLTLVFGDRFARERGSEQAAAADG